MEKIKLFEAFAGYGSQSLALQYLGLEFEHVGFSEIDKYAITAHHALHGDVTNYGDISKIDPKTLPEFNLFTYSFPCQDISNAGRQRGLEKGSGTRSGLLWECERIIRHKRPTYLLMENVKALVNKKFKPYFDKWCEELEDLGYTNHWEVLNAKDFGVPQNRERVFMVSILDGDLEPGFKFPEAQKLDRSLRDVLEEKVDDRYYIGQKTLAYFKRNNAKQKNEGNGFTFRVAELDKPAKCISVQAGNRMTDNFVACAQRGRNPENPTSRVSGAPTEQMLESNGGEVSNCLTTVQKDSMVAEIKTVGSIPEWGQNGGVSSEDGVSPTVKATSYKCPPLVETSDQIIRAGHIESGRTRRDPEENRVYEARGVSPCLTSQGKSPKALIDMKIRKLTPLECFRLMGVDDFDFDVIKASLVQTHYNGRDSANTQLYKMAGNSIVVDVLMSIWKSLFIDRE